MNHKLTFFLFAFLALFLLMFALAATGEPASAQWYTPTPARPRATATYAWPTPYDLEQDPPSAWDIFRGPTMPPWLSRTPAPIRVIGTFTPIPNVTETLPAWARTGTPPVYIVGTTAPTYYAAPRATPQPTRRFSTPQRPTTMPRPAATRPVVTPEPRW